MNIAEKLPYAEAAARSIWTHTDSPPEVRRAALARLREICDEGEAAIDAEVADALASQGLGPAPAED